MFKTLVVGLLCLTTAVGWCDQLYVRNRPFKGKATAVGKNLSSIRVDLNDLCKAADLTLSPVGENWVVHSSAEQPPELPAGSEGLTGKLFVQGKELTFEDQGGARLVSLQDFSKLWGARLTYNASMQTVDLNFVPSAPTASGEGKPSQAAAYVPSSKYRIVAFGATW